MLESKIWPSWILFLILLVLILNGPQLLGYVLQNEGLVVWINLLSDWPDEVDWQRVKNAEVILDRALVFVPHQHSIRQGLADILLDQLK